LRDRWTGRWQGAGRYFGRQRYNILTFKTHPNMTVLQRCVAGTAARLRL